MVAAIVLLVAVVAAIIVLLVKKKKLRQPAAVRDWGAEPPWQEQNTGEEDSLELFEISGPKGAAGEQEMPAEETPQQHDEGDFT